MKVLLPWICFSLFLVAVTATSVSVRKCCPSGEALADKSNVKNPACVKNGGKILQSKNVLSWLLTLLIGNKWNDIQASDQNKPGTLVSASLQAKEVPKIPKCVKGFEIHALDPGKSIWAGFSLTLTPWYLRSAVTGWSGFSPQIWNRIFCRALLHW